jgi:hypothetical protein
MQKLLFRLARYSEYPKTGCLMSRNIQYPEEMVSGY